MVESLRAAAGAVAAVVPGRSGQESPVEEEEWCIPKEASGGAGCRGGHVVVWLCVAGREG